VSWWDPIFNVFEFRAFLELWLGGLKRESVSTNQAWLSFNFFA